MDSIIVDLDERSYPILFGELSGIGKSIEALFTDRKVISLAVVSNTLVGKIYKDVLIESFSKSNKIKILCYIEIQDGEEHKNMKTYFSLVDQLLDSKIDRTSVLVALGGGVTTDICGFAAATILRGIDFVNVPTTLLAMVDASVGGKTGVNTKHGKNLVGSFWQPKLVYAAIDSLSSLPDDEFRCGLGEVVKHAVLDESPAVEYMDNLSFMEWMIKNGERIALRDPSLVKLCVRRSCEVKAAIVAQDERENDKRALLNLGHTIAHAIEFVQGIDSSEGLRHGEAVAIGTLAEIQLSLSRNVCKDPALEQKFIYLLKACRLPTGVENLNVDSLIDASFMDKKRESDVIKVTLPVTVANVILEKLKPNDLRPAFEFISKNARL